MCGGRKTESGSHHNCAALCVARTIGGLLH